MLGERLSRFAFQTSRFRRDPSVGRKSGVTPCAWRLAHKPPPLDPRWAHDVRRLGTSPDSLKATPPWTRASATGPDGQHLFRLHATAETVGHWRATRCNRWSRMPGRIGDPSSSISVTRTRQVSSPAGRCAQRCGTWSGGPRRTAPGRNSGSRKSAQAACCDVRLACRREPG